MDVLLWFAPIGMSRIKKIYIITGEASGDYHAGMLLKAMQSISGPLKTRGWGGNQLQSAGMQVDVPYETANFMGFVEVLRNLPRIMQLFKLTKKAIRAFKPDVLLLVDYPGFNLRMAEWAYANGIPVIYFIAPQIWAWKESRINIMKRCVQKLYVILPFEFPYFKDRGINTAYHGHPLVEKIRQHHTSPEFRNHWNLDQRSIIAILPGSRQQEIRMLLPIYLRALQHENKHQIAIAGMRRHQTLYESIIRECNVDAVIVYDEMYNLLKQAELAVVTSGTASLETALFEVPMVVCYKGNWISYQIAKRLVKVKYIALANLIADKPIVQELIQDECNVNSIQKALQNLLDPHSRSMIKAQLKELTHALYEEDCYLRIAEDMLPLISTSNA